MDSSISNRATDEAINRMLASSSTSSSANEHAINPLYEYQEMDSSANYSAYQLAWHLLGFFVDCSITNSYGTGCPRQVLYSVYVNPKYEDGGIGAYSYYDQKTKKWKCYSDNCSLKMDCHLPETEWKLLGIFKIDSISDQDGWMEQLFKHQGVCIWGEDTYYFASLTRKSMPDKCQATSQQLADGTYLYYDVKPQLDANITLGLYTDNMCSQEYEGSVKYDVFALAGSEEWHWVYFNEAMNVYKQCQPCLAYDLAYDGFDCYDKAGYTNCNQCMKFSNKAQCEIATKSDVMLAARQRGLISFEFNGITYGAGGIGQSNVEFPKKTKWESSEKVIGVTTISSMSSASSGQEFPLLIVSILFASLGLAAFVHSSAKESKKTDKSINLLDDSGAGDDPSTKSKKSWKSLASIQVAGSKILEKLSKSFIFNEKDKLEPTIAGVTEPSVSFRENGGDDDPSTSAKSPHSNSLASIQVAGSKVLEKISKSFIFNEKDEPEQSEPAIGSFNETLQGKDAEAELEDYNTHNAVCESDVGAFEVPAKSFGRSTKSKKSSVSIIQIGSQLFRKLSNSIGNDTKKETKRYESDNNVVVQKKEDLSAEPVVLENSGGENVVEKYEDKTAESKKEDNIDATFYFAEI
eukprot:CAMPEP_0172418252 /NCGR_PEP_ID=MMETSP1064-20121228/4771_1 /TAXON_ID=202472 /ORGANISM="Aulacoseira subarctica , Strain CCAP 1002/5" /LENGTH=633 /DNA_ID=CAMNT_0013157107 /DNA_START=225 /DNA_END=2126 /DNA_ORIENTATION=-